MCWLASYRFPGRREEGRRQGSSQACFSPHPPSSRANTYAKNEKYALDNLFIVNYIVRVRMTYGRPHRIIERSVIMNMRRQKTAVHSGVDNRKCCILFQIDAEPDRRTSSKIWYCKPFY